ncbi:MAG: hypothetical protein EB092_07035 [Chitinophagia bacterium]|nr:hypothetical protein [Chitinophagia bacterium]NCA30345.1 hypothetical protein [Chitinophagia bacterium]NDD16745.1 hypothetical protein [Chitinophagia bacterium]
MACADKKPDLTGNTPLTINDFNKVFKAVSLPVSISDSNINRFTDTLIIGRKALAQFVPDSVVEDIIGIKDNKALLHPIIRIEKEEEYYLLLNVSHPKKQEIAVVVFSKKNKFLDYKVITEFNEENQSSKMYGKNLNINREPSFLVEENKLAEDNTLTYEKKGWAYTDSSFRLIYFDSNKKPETKKILNPLDTMSMNYTFSGDYARDAKNFISIRDYNTANKYQFFLHFEKKEGSCIGELKGLLTFTKNQATYSEKGDPCIIHFTIQGNVINIKEDGNCGNHRNMTCYFNDSYDKKRKPKKKK